MEITLLGTGDTTGTPTPRCSCDTCAYARERSLNRSRFSVHVYNDRTDQSILIDMSPDFRQQFLDNDVDLPDAVLITHLHFDHLDGLGNAYRLFDHLDVHAGADVDPTTGESVAGSIRSKYDYLDRITVHDRSPYSPFTVAGLEATFVPVEHPPLLGYGVVVTDPESGATFAMTGDTNYAIPEASRKALTGADLLLVDGLVPGQFSEYHPLGGAHHDDDGVPRTFGDKHMTIEGAHAMADRLGPARYRIVHVSHYVPVDQAFEDPLAVDGEQYTL